MKHNLSPLTQALLILSIGVMPASRLSAGQDPLIHQTRGIAGKTGSPPVGSPIDFDVPVKFNYVKPLPDIRKKESIPGNGSYIVLPATQVLELDWFASHESHEKSQANHENTSGISPSPTAKIERSTGSIYTGDASTRSTGINSLPAYLIRATRKNDIQDITRSIHSPFNISPSHSLSYNKNPKTTSSRQTAGKQAGTAEGHSATAQPPAPASSVVSRATTPLITMLIHATATTSQAATLSEPVIQENPQKHWAIISEAIFLKAVEDDPHRLRFNSCNHWTVEDKPDDYQVVIEKAYANRWIALKGKEGEDYHRYELPKHMVKILADGMDSYFRNKCKISSKAEDDIEDEVQTRYKELDQQLKDRDWFVRTDLCSLKSTWVYGEKRGKQKVYSNAEELFLSMTTAPDRHNPIYALDNKRKPINLYLFPWVDIDPNREFRVFVHNNRVTAISQQDLYQRNDLLASLDATERQVKINDWCKQIIEFIHKTVNPVFEEASYVADIAILDDADSEQAYFIEINPFGSQYTSGSALFHWLHDKEILYGNAGESISFRYVE